MKTKDDATLLRALLARTGLSQRAAARELNISERTMRYYIAGEQPVPRAVRLSLEYLAGDPAFFARLEARARIDAGCQCGAFEIATYKSDEPGIDRSVASISPGHCKACADGITTRTALRLLGESGTTVRRSPETSTKRARAKK